MLIKRLFFGIIVLNFGEPFIKVNLLLQIHIFVIILSSFNALLIVSNQTRNEISLFGRLRTGDLAGYKTVSQSGVFNILGEICSEEFSSSLVVRKLNIIHDLILRQFGVQFMKGYTRNHSGTAVSAAAM